jgi:hypothetical protein
MRTLKFKWGKTANKFYENLVANSDLSQHCEENYEYNFL